MYDEWMKDMPIITSVYNKKIEKVYEGTIEPKKEEKEYPHIIGKLKPKKKLHRNRIETITIYPDNEELMNKINEIIEVVNIMNRGGRKWDG